MNKNTNGLLFYAKCTIFAIYFTLNYFTQQVIVYNTTGKNLYAEALINTIISDDDANNRNKKKNHPIG